MLLCTRPALAHTHITMLSQLCVENDLHIATFCLLMTLGGREVEDEEEEEEAGKVKLLTGRPQACSSPVLHLI